MRSRWSTWVRTPWKEIQDLGLEFAPERVIAPRVAHERRRLMLQPVALEGERKRHLAGGARGLAARRKRRAPPPQACGPRASASSARRRMAAMTGQSGLSRMKAAIRSKPTHPKRTATHSLRLRSTGSVNPAFARSPPAMSPFRNSSMARRKASYEASGLASTPRASGRGGSAAGAPTRSGSALDSWGSPSSRDCWLGSAGAASQRWWSCALR